MAKKNYSLAILVFLLMVATVLNSLTLRKNLPFVHEVDEQTFVDAAVNISDSGSLNPGFFGHPGSTLIYPLVLIYHLKNSLENGDFFNWPDEGMRASMDESSSIFYYSGRLLSLLYALLTLPVLFLVSRQAFNKKAALLAVLLYIFIPTVIHFNTYIRTESVTIFFILLSLWRILKTFDQPSWGNHLWSGVFIGLAIASRYFAAALIPLLLTVDLIHLIKRSDQRREILVSALSTMLVIIFIFIAVTPFMLLDPKNFLGDILNEARDFHPGVVVMSRPENFSTIIFTHIPSIITWPQAILAVIGIFLAGIRKNIPQILLAWFGLLFLLVISFPALNWDRWVIPAIPVLVMFTAYGLLFISGEVSQRLRLNSAGKFVFTGLLIGLIWVYPAFQSIQYSVRSYNKSTRLIAREWIIENIPPGSKIALDYYTPPLSDLDYELLEVFNLSSNKNLDFFYEEDFQYLVVSSGNYDRYISKQEFFPEDAGFYLEIFEEENQVYEVGPSRFRGGPVIKVFELSRR